MNKNIPPEVIEYVIDVMRDYLNADHLRICVAGDMESMNNYEKLKRSCCGSVDYQQFWWNGIEYLYGFNYCH